MAFLSCLLDLRRAKTIWKIRERSLPDRITIPSNEEVRAVNLPNASLCADFLVSSGNIWSGVAVGVNQKDIATVQQMFRLCDPNLVTLVLPSEATRRERYRQYGGWAWLEVVWLPSGTPKLVEVQTSDVLWYASAGNEDNDVANVIVLGLEGVATLLEEPGIQLAFPEEWGMS